MIHVSSKFQCIDIITFSIIAVLPCLDTVLRARRLVIAVILQKKAWYLQNQINEKDRNTLKEQSTQRSL